MSANIIYKKEQKKTEEICPSEKSNLQNVLNGSSKTKPKKRKNNAKSSALKPNTTEININLLYFENNNINPRKYFAEKRSVDQINQKSPDKNKEINNIKNITIPVNNCSDNIDNISFFSFEFLEPEDEETKNKRKEIIQKMEAKTDDIIFEGNFDIFDYSKMDFIISETGFSGEKIQKEQIINTNYNSKSTEGYSSPNSAKIELIKKSKNKNNKKYEKRKNRFKFKGSKKEKRIDKSNSIRKKERTRSRSNSSFVQN